MSWISSGVPISQPEPEALARGLLAERGLQLSRDSSAGAGTRSRRGIGYVCGNAELIRLAHVVRDDVAEAGYTLSCWARGGSRPGSPPPRDGYVWGSVRRRRRSRRRPWSSQCRRLHGQATEALPALTEYARRPHRKRCSCEPCEGASQGGLEPHPHHGVAVVLQGGVDQSPLPHG